MKNIAKIFKMIPVLFFGIAITLLSIVSCEDDIKFNDNVPDYTNSIIRDFKVNGQSATIGHTNAVITYTLPAGSDLTKVPVTITLPDGATVDPASGSTVDFSKGPVIFTVTNNGISRKYTASVAAYGSPMIMSFSIGENVGVINENAGTIAVTVSYKEDLTRLTPLYIIPGGTTSTPQSGVAQDFSIPVKYTVISNNGYTGKSYYVNVTKLPDPFVTSFKTSTDVCGVAGIINNTNSTIVMDVPSGTNLTSISPVISLTSGSTISPASGVAQNFSNGAVTYTVTSSAGETKTYSVTVRAIDSSKKVVFLGEADCISTLEDDDAKAAAEYLKSQYPNDFAYIKIQDITASALANTNVVMLYYLAPVTSGTNYFATDTNVMTLLPSALRPGAPQASALTNWVKNGGNLFLAGDPTAFIHVLGRMPANYSSPRAIGNYRYTEFGCAGQGGCVDTNKPSDDIWGLGVRDENNSGNRRNHPIFNGLTFNGSGELYLNNAGTREVRLIWWQHMDGILSPGCCGQDAALLFEQTVNATKLGTLRWIGDAFGYGAIEFKPTNGTVSSNFDTNIGTSFKGTVITLENTIIGYEFKSNAGRANDYQNNIEKLTKNIINYLNK